MSLSRLVSFKPFKPSFAKILLGDGDAQTASGWNHAYLFRYDHQTTWISDLGFRQDASTRVTVSVVVALGGKESDRDRDDDQPFLSLSTIQLVSIHSFARYLLNTKSKQFIICLFFPTWCSALAASRKSGPSQMRALQLYTHRHLSRKCTLGAFHGQRILSTWQLSGRRPHRTIRRQGRPSYPSHLRRGHLLALFRFIDRSESLVQNQRMVRPCQVEMNIRVDSTRLSRHSSRPDHPPLSTRHTPEQGRSHLRPCMVTRRGRFNARAV